jgi:tetratricopeptide (TPR) repeat protein
LPGDYDFSWGGDEKKEPSAYDKAMRLGDGYAVRAASEIRPRVRGYPPVRPTVTQLSLAERALKAYEDAAKADPTKGEPHYRAAVVINAHWLANESHYSPMLAPHARRAVHHWQEFERLAPLDPRVRAMLNTRTLVRTKLASDKDFEHALADYERLMRLSPSDSLIADEAARRLSNMAEIYMMLGRLDEAITRYKESLDYAHEPSHALGLAVALDRDGQRVKAREVARTYFSESAWARFKYHLEEDLVFFVPPGEVYYYDGLIHEVFDMPSEAIDRYRSFIRSGAHPQFQARARENIEDLRKQIQKNKKGKRKRGKGGR